MRTRGPLSLLFATVLLLGSGCATPAAPAPESGTFVDSLARMNAIAPAYVKLVLAVGQHDKDYVDAFYGPREWKTEAEASKKPLAAIASEADALIARLQALPEPADEMQRLRKSYLTRQLKSLTARVAMLGGKKLSFDEESRALYDAVAPVNTEEHFRAVRDELDRALPGAGGAASLVERYEAWRKDFTIPTEKVDAVFRTAIGECRDRTIQHMTLPPGERFTVEYVTQKSWGGYNWYQGSYRSVIQVNTDFPITIDRAIDLACHEGYPGHHVYNALLEKNLVRDHGWGEYTVYPLFSPQSLIAEGSANFGIEMAFPGSERVEYERAKLYPLAGLDPARAEEFDHVRGHVRIGVDILNPLRHLGQAVLYVQDHHEHWDGGGYPRGLTGENISLGGRILCAADAFDALTSARSYRGALTPEATIDYLTAHSGSLVDPTVFDVLATVVRRGRALVFIDDA